MYDDAFAVFVCVNTGFGTALIAGVEVVPPPQTPGTGGFGVHAAVVGVIVALFVALPALITVPLTV
jgi:hypothetical protein